MTRRKRTPSPVAPRKPTNFEIPASLQQLSELSRSLAEQADHISSSENVKNGVKIIQPGNQDRSRLQHGSSSTPRPKQFNPPQQDNVVKLLPQKRPFLESEPWPQSRAKTSPLIPSMPSTDHNVSQRAWSQMQSPVNLPHQPSTPSFSNSPGDGDGDEPVLNSGETLSLERHAGQIAALMAKKRAENEMNSNRQRWIKEQDAHFKSKTNHMNLPMEASSVSVDVETPQSSHLLTLKANLPLTPNSNTSSQMDLKDNSFIQPSKDRSKNNAEYVGGFIDGTSPRNDRASHQQVPQTLRLSTSGSSSSMPDNPEIKPQSLPYQRDSPTIFSAKSITPHSQNMSYPVYPRSTSRADINTEAAVIPPLFSDRPRSKPIPGSQSYPSQHSIERHMSHSPFSSRPTNPTNKPHTQAIPNMTAGYYKIDPRLWSSSNNDAISQPSFVRPSPVLTSTTPTYWNSPQTSSTQYYGSNGPPPTTTLPRYTTFSHGSNIHASFRNATQGEFTVPKR